MKKIISILLILLILCLTACNNQTVETSTSTSKTGQTEIMSTSQTTENIQTSETTISSETTNQAEKTNENQGYQVPKELKNKIVSYDRLQPFIELPSRIVFTHRTQKDELIGNRYGMTIGTQFICYYSKVDGETYIYCFDPLCEHKDCSAYGKQVHNLVFCNNRFYTGMLKNIYTFAFDGTDERILKLPEECDGFSFLFSQIYAYDQYVYITATAPNGNYHMLKIDTVTEKIIDLTEKLGRFIGISFFYNGKIYGSDGGNLIRCDLSFENIETYAYPKWNDYFTEGSSFITLETMKTEEGFTKTIGIKTYDMETEEETFIKTEVIGQEVSNILYIDENYFYFTANAPVVIGKSENGYDYTNNSGGKLYRVNRDGTNCICIYENSKIELINAPASIYKDSILLYARECGIVGGEAQYWNESIYIGHFNEDGTINSLEWVEVIA